MDPIEQQGEDIRIQSSTPQSSTPNESSLDAAPEASPHEHRLDAVLKPELHKDQNSTSSQSTTPLTRAQRAKNLQPGQMIAERYKVLSFIGRGGIGSVYKVEQVLLKKELALKTIDPVVTSDVTIRRFQREAQAASRLKHANLVQAIDFGLIDGTRPFLVMDLLEGHTLAQHLNKCGQLSVDAALQLFIPICFGMAYAHQEGVVHRDIKPSNIVLVKAETEDQLIPKVVDFGIARIEEEEAQALTKTGEVFGTPLYMSPEQCHGFRVDQRTDIYSLGCVLYESLTGAPPFKGSTALETMMRHQSDTPSSLKEASLGLEFPVALEHIVAKMLAKKPDERYQSFIEVAQDLVRLQQGQNVRVQFKEPAAPPRTKQYSLSTLILVALSSIIATAFTFWVLANIGIISSPVNTNNVISSVVDKQKETLTTSELDRQKKSQGETAAADETAAAAAPYSKIKGDTRIFHIPPGHNLGSFYWWDHDHLKQEKKANKSVVELPKSARLIFKPDYETYENRQWLSQLGCDALSGVFLESFTGGAPVEPEDSNQMVLSLKKIEPLRALILRNTRLSEEAFSSIGDLKDLHWLKMDNAETRGERIARLKNLAKLKVLSLHFSDKPPLWTTSVTPIFEKLATSKTPIKRLSLSHCHLDAKDFELISRISKLEYLDLGPNVVEIDRWAPPPDERRSILASLAKMTGLKRLSLTEDVAGRSPTDRTNFLTALSHLRNLQYFCYGGYWQNKGALVDRLRQCLPPGCKIVDHQGKYGDNSDAWFDPRDVDPSIDDLW